MTSARNQKPLRRNLIVQLVADGVPRDQISRELGIKRTTIADVLWCHKNVESWNAMKSAGCRRRYIPVDRQPLAPLELRIPRNQRIIQLFKAGKTYTEIAVELATRRCVVAGVLSRARRRGDIGG